LLKLPSEALDLSLQLSYPSLDDPVATLRWAARKNAGMVVREGGWP
jgi:hypothetical protein